MIGGADNGVSGKKSGVRQIFSNALFLSEMIPTGREVLKTKDDRSQRHMQSRLALQIIIHPFGLVRLGGRDEIRYAHWR